MSVGLVCPFAFDTGVCLCWLAANFVCEICWGNNRAPRLSFLFPLGFMMGFIPLVPFSGRNKPFPFGSQFCNGVLFLLVCWFDATRRPFPPVVEFWFCWFITFTSVWQQRSTRLLFVLLLQAFSPLDTKWVVTPPSLFSIKYWTANALCVLTFNGYYNGLIFLLRLMSDSWADVQLMQTE